MKDKVKTIIQNSNFQIITLVLLTILAYSNIFSNGFVIDDKSFIGGWEGTKSLANIPQFFAGAVPPGHEGVYRPLRSVLYAIYYQVFGTNIFWYHLHSILVHLGSTILVYFITRELVYVARGPSAAVSRRVSSVVSLPAGTRRDPSATSPLATSFIPFITALLFGLQPIHTETITYIASSMDAVGMMFMFLSFYLYLRAQLTPGVKKMQLHPRGVILGASVVSALAAYFTNETTLILPLLLILYNICFRKLGFVSNFGIRYSNLLLYLPYFAGVLIYFMVRFFALQITSRGPYLADSIYFTFLTMTKVFVKYISLILLPLNQANNHTISKGIEAFVYRGYSPDAIKAQTLFDAEVLLCIVVIIALFLLAWKMKKKLPIVTFGIGWFFISLLPVSEIIPQGSMLGERFLYIPSFGAILIIGYCLGIIFNFKFLIFNKNFKLQISNSLKNIVLTTFIAIICGYFYLTYTRNKDWHDETSLWSKDIKVYPDSNAYAYFQLGNVYLGNNQLDKALSNYNRSFEINPHFAVAIASAGRADERQGNKDEAVKNYQKAINTDPNFWEGYIILGAINIEDGNFDFASKYYQKLSTIYPQYTVAKDILDQLSRIEPGAKNLKVQNGGIFKAFSNRVITFSYPADWRFEDGKTEFKLTSSGEKLKIDIKKIATKENSIEDYLKSKKATFGLLKNQGPAKIPQFDDSFVKVWQDPQDGDILKLQFLLLKGEDILEVLVYPADSPLMRQFDEILASIKIVTPSKR
ncbi:tetratricopeptide repeat protein [Candidatus Daviesbacteria bacterium]|nr:tetratricopeptide repeat protein [Candidatus Daviesbacteria bacterium]